MVVTKEFEAKSIMIGRLPRKEGDKFKIAGIKLFGVNNPHMTSEFPLKEIELNNIEKIRIRGLNLTYYLEGNDIIINDLSKIKIEHDDTLLVVTATQEGEDLA